VSRGTASPSTIARQRERQRIVNEVAREQAAEQAAREDRAATVVRERAQRDAQVRARANELFARVAAARRRADDADVDLDSACAALAAGQVAFEQVEPIAAEHEAAVRALSIWTRAAASVKDHPALVGRH
jgi:hypothetical protein